MQFVIFFIWTFLILHALEENAADVFLEGKLLDYELKESILQLTHLFLLQLAVKEQGKKRHVKMTRENDLV